MTLLAATFVFAGMWFAIHSWEKLKENHSNNAFAVPAALWYAVAVGGCGVLSVLAKENGALLPLLILVVESTLLVKLLEQGSVGFRLFLGGA